MINDNEHKDEDTINTLQNIISLDNDFKSVVNLSNKKCTRVTINNVIFDGLFMNDNLVEGKIIYPNGDIFYGKFEDNNVLVEGSKIFTNGNIYQGIFIDKNISKGKIIFANSTVF